MKCNKCKNVTLENLHYVIATNGDKHLVGNCHVCGARFMLFIEGLDIPTLKSKELQKLERKKRKKEQQPSLLK